MFLKVKFQEGNFFPILRLLTDNIDTSLITKSNRKYIQESEKESDMFHMDNFTCGNTIIHELSRTVTKSINSFQPSINFYSWLPCFTVSLIM